MVLARRLLVGCIFVALLVGGWYFAARNGGLVTINLPHAELGEFKLWVVLSATFGLGVSFATLIAVYRGARMRLVARRYKKLLADLQAEVHQLRNLPLAEAGDPSTSAPGTGALERGS